MNNEAARALRIYMAYLSEEGWCAGWVSHLEFTLWEQVLKWRAGIELSSDEEADGSHWAKDAQACRDWQSKPAAGGNGQETEVNPSSWRSKTGNGSSRNTAKVRVTLP